MLFRSETVLEWFDGQSQQLDVIRKDATVSIHFEDFGPIGTDESGNFAAHLSPLVSVFLPRTRRGILVTVGEVHFFPSNLARAFPGLERVRRRFKSWLDTNSVAYDRKDSHRPESTYFFESGILNVADRITALPSGEALLTNGTYFVPDRSPELMLDILCKTLRLRGIDCESPC